MRIETSIERLESVGTVVKARTELDSTPASVEVENASRFLNLFTITQLAHSMSSTSSPSPYSPRSPSPCTQIHPTEMPMSTAKQIVLEAEDFAQKQFARLADPSHDWAHILRVRDLAFRFRGCRSIKHIQSGDEWLELQEKRVADDDDDNEYCQVRCDYLVLELAALFHDLVDPKLFPLDSSKSLEDQAAAILSPFWGVLSTGEAYLLHPEQKERIIKIICNVGWSKDEKRRKALHDKWNDWERKQGFSLTPASKFEYGHLYYRGVQSWPEWRAISDADRVDAIGATGLMRCAAYSGITRRPLLPSPSCKDAPTTSSDDESAHSHILSKLLQIKGDRLFHLEAKLEAERRQAVMRPFVLSLAREMNLATPEEHRCDAACDEQRERVKRRRITREGEANAQAGAATAAAAAT